MNKYRNIKVRYNNQKFDSKKECKRYIELKLLEKAHLIKELECQKRFILQESFIDNQGNKIRPITYIADYYYYDNEIKSYIAEDVKSKITQQDKTYRLKKKLFLYKYKDIIFKEEV